MIPSIFKKMILIGGLFILGSMLFTTPVLGDWNDLEEGEHRAYGSEKEKKYPINAFIIEKEEWEGHYALMILGFYKNVDYPKYTYSRFFPFYSNLKSKIDNREKTWGPLYLYYNKIEGDKETTHLFPLYYSRLQKKSADRSLLYLIWWGNKSTYRESSYFNIYPLFYHDYSMGKEKKSRESETTFIPFFYHKSLEWDSKGKEQYEIEQASIFYYRHSRDSDAEGGKLKTVWIPLIPLVYYKTTADYTHTNLFWLFDIAWQKDELKRSWFVPLWLMGFGDDGYKHFLPPVYLSTYHKDGSYYKSLIPAFIAWKSIGTHYGESQYKRYEKKSLYTPVYCSHDKTSYGTKPDEKRVEEDTFWYPVLPLYYSSYERERGTHRNLLWIVDWHKEESGNLKRFWIIPIAFYNRHVEGDPLKQHTETKSFYSPFYCSYDKAGYNFKKSDKTIEEDSLWYPILPLYYSSYERGKGTHRNALWLFDWHKNDSGNMKRFWFIPVAFYKKDSYLHILPPVFLSWETPQADYYLGPLFYQKRHTEGHQTYALLMWHSYYEPRGEGQTHVLPLFYSLRSDSKDYHENTHTLLPLWYYSYFHNRETHVEGRSSITALWYYDRESIIPSKDKEINTGTRFCLPIIPVIFYSYSSVQESHKNFLMVFDWKRDGKGNLSRFWLPFPLVMNKMGEGGYRYVLPFFFRPSGWTEKKGYSFGPFHYHRWNEEEDLYWVAIRYHRENRVKKEEVSHWIPLYYSWSNTRFLWMNKSTGTLFLPVVLNYEDEKRTLHVNILGYARSTLKGPLTPGVSLGVGTTKKDPNKWYLDTDVSWLYEVVLVSYRDSFRKFWKSKDAVDTDKPVSDIKPEEASIGKKTEGKPVPPVKTVIATGKKASDKKAVDTKLAKDASPKPRMKKDKTISRETSEHYFGWKILFGWTQYEKADTKRHWHMLPLGWVSWDEESAYKMHVTPVYLSFKDEEEEYFAAFPILPLPLYGYRNQGDSYVNVYFINAYWSEYDAAKKEYEYTILWPFINWYGSPDRNGWRLFPLFWHKENLKKESYAIRTITPVYFRNLKTYQDGHITDFALSPYFMSYKTQREDNIDHTVFFPVIPVVYYSLDQKSFEYEAGSKTDGFMVKGQYKTEKFMFFPLFFDVNRQVSKSSEKKPRRYYTLYGLPLLYYDSYSGPVEGKETSDETHREKSFFLMGFYRHSSPEKSITAWFPFFYRSRTDARIHYNIVGIIDWERDLKASERTVMGLPLFYYKNRKKDGYMTVPLLLTHHAWEGDDESRLYLLGLFHYRSNIPNKEKKVALYPVFHYKTEKNKGHLTFPLLLTHRAWEGDDESRLYLLGLFHYRNNIPQKEKKVALYPLFHYQDYKDTGHFSIPLLLSYYGWETEKERELCLLGILQYKNNRPRQEKSFALFPLVMSRWSPKGYSHLFAFTYWHDSETYSRQNLYFLYDHENFVKDQRQVWDLLFGTVEYESSRELSRFRMFYGVLAGYTNYRNRPDYSFNILWLGAEKRDRSFELNIIPLWYYDRYDDNTRHIIPPLLSYISTSPNEEFRLLVGSLLWYKNYNPVERVGSSRVLFWGMLWNEVYKKERGFHSVGMLWDLLFDYETETETGYSKFSILKFLYKRVELNGEVSHRVMGIKL